MFLFKFNYFTFYFSSKLHFHIAISNINYVIFTLNQCSLNLMIKQFNRQINIDNIIKNNKLDL